MFKKIPYFKACTFFYKNIYKDETSTLRRNEKILFLKFKHYDFPIGVLFEVEGLEGCISTT